MKNKIEEKIIEHGDIEFVDNNIVYAKNISFKYYVLASSKGDLFDVCDSSLDKTRIDNNRGKNQFSLVSCSKKCFDFYVKFLKFKNKADLRIAQRSLSNGEK